MIKKYFFTHKLLRRINNLIDLFAVNISYKNHQILSAVSFLKDKITQDIWGIDFRLI